MKDFIQDPAVVVGGGIIALLLIMLVHYNTNVPGNPISVYCDTATNVEYLVWSGSKKGSMTPRLNLDGTVARCSE